MFSIYITILAGRRQWYINRYFAALYATFITDLILSIIVYLNVA